MTNRIVRNLQVFLNAKNNDFNERLLIYNIRKEFDIEYIYLLLHNYDTMI